MKGEFISFDQENCRCKDAAPKVHFAHYGLISLNESAVNLIGLKPGDRIRLLQNKRNPKEWFLSKDTSGFVLRKAYDKKCKSLIVNNAFAVKALASALGKDKSFAVKLGLQPDGDGWWSLITSGVK